MDRIIDFHAHILPGADHGSKSVTTSLKQLELIKKTGADTVVATPHFYPSSMKVEDFLALRKRTADDLIKAGGADSGLKLVLGAEVLVCEKLDSMPGLEKLCISGTNCILLEMPMKRWKDEYFDAVDRISERHTVVLAHIDRYPLEDVLQFLDFEGVFAQMNPCELTKFFVNKKYKELINRGWVVALGSDLHSSDEKRSADFAKAIKKLGRERTESIMEKTADLLEGAEYLF